MKLLDISWPLEHGLTTEYKDRTTLALEHRSQFDRDGMEESALCMGTHTGTHIEAPAHFIKDGKTLDQFSLSSFIGECKVLDLTLCQEIITREDLERFTIESDTIVLLKTSNSLLPSTGKFNPEYISLSHDGAKYLVQMKVKAVGIDYLSLERNRPDHPAHKELLSQDCLIIEGLRLAPVTQGTYIFYCLPLKLIHTEAAPARAILVQP